MLRQSIKTANARGGSRLSPAAVPPAPPANLATRVAALETQVAAQQTTITTQAGQITALQSALNAKASMDDVNAAIVANSAANVNSMEGLEGSPSDPPTQGDVLQLYYFGNNLLQALKRPV